MMERGGVFLLPRKKEEREREKRKEEKPIVPFLVCRTSQKKEGGSGKMAEKKKI